MTTLAEARRELAQIAERQAELQKIVDAAPKSLLTANGGPNGSNVAYWMNSPAVEDTNVAHAYADALDTLLMLRHQPGSEVARDEEAQWAIECSDDGKSLRLSSWGCINYKVPYLSPCFSTREAAQAAIDTIGADRILRMFRTLHGVA